MPSHQIHPSRTRRSQLAPQGTKPASVVSGDGLARVCASHGVLRGNMPLVWNTSTGEPEKQDDSEALIRGCGCAGWPCALSQSGGIDVVERLCCPYWRLRKAPPRARKPNGNGVGGAKRGAPAIAPPESAALQAPFVHARQAQRCRLIHVGTEHSSAGGFGYG